jgi:hypothetical protein
MSPHMCPILSMGYIPYDDLAREMIKTGEEGGVFKEQQIKDYSINNQTLPSGLTTSVDFFASTSTMVQYSRPQLRTQIQ